MAMSMSRKSASRRDRSVTLAAVVALGALAAAPPADAFHMEDGLRGRTMGNQLGGALTSDGWRVTDRTDRIWYALPRLVSGSVEFTVTNITMSSLGVVDNEIFAMYEAGYGITEPIRYSPEFRNNHFKCMLRIYGNAETGREGAQKIIWEMCGSGAPGYDPCTCGTGFGAEPFALSGAWDGTAQRLRIEWGGGHTRYLRNGREVFSIDWSESGWTYAPSVLHMSLGTARPSATDAALPVGAVFTDLVVDGTEGPMATCGVPEVPPDAGTVTPPANVIDLPAVEDVTVAPHLPTSVYPVPADLSVGAGDSEFYVKFRVGSLPGRVVRAQLLLNSSTDRSATGSGASLFSASSDAWSESTLVWNARPGPRGARLARVNGVSVDQPYAFDLPTGAVTAPGTYAFAVLPEAGDTDAAHFDSKEVSPSRGPVLRLTIDPSMPPDADAGVSTPDVPLVRDVPAAMDAIATIDVPTAVDVLAVRDAGATLDAAGDDDGGVREVVDSPGCACRAGAGTRGRHGGLAVAVAVAVAAGRRRKRATGGAAHDRRDRRSRPL